MNATSYYKTMSADDKAAAKALAEETGQSLTQIIPQIMTDAEKAAVYTEPQK